MSAKKRAVAVVAVLAMSASVSLAQDMMFGGEEDMAYAADIWKIMVELDLAGPDSMQIRAYPFEGTDPHGMMLETFYTSTMIGGHTGALIIKRNYGPEGVTVDQVMNEPAKHLRAITVMFQRELGYDADNQDWFWVKFLPDGTLDKNPKGVALAGMVAKGMDVNEQQNRFGITPLHAASEENHIEVVKYLLDNGAEVHRVEASGPYTPLSRAGYREHWEVVDLLIQHGARCQPLEIAGEWLDVECKKRLN